MTEKTIAYFCAPALAGIKPSNIVSFGKGESGNIHSEIEELNKKLNHKDIYFEILCECDRHTLIMVYRKKLLENRLNEAEAMKFLSGYGYDCELEKSIEILKKRLTECEFPHEIGVFLGYPLKDILGFITHRGKDCLLAGEWKVYADAERAREVFRRYEVCRCAILKRIEHGKTLAEIFCAA